MMTQLRDMNSVYHRERVTLRSKDWLQQNFAGVSTGKKMRLNGQRNINQINGMTGVDDGNED